MQLEKASPRHARSLTLPRIRVRLRGEVVVWLCALAAGAVSFAVYLATMAPSVMWYDMGEFAVVSSTLGIAHNTGYPLLILTGKAFTFVPFGETAWRVNLVSPVFTSLAVMVTFVVIRDLTGESIGAAIGSLTLAFASTIWSNATWATSYGMNLFFVALITLLVLRWHRERTPRLLVFASLAFGLALCNHRLIVLLVPGIFLITALGWRAISARTAALSAFALVAGLSLYLYVPIRGEMEPAISWAQPAQASTYWSMFLNGQTPANYWSIDFVDRIDILWTYPSYDHTWAGLMLAAGGLAICAAYHRVAAAYLALLIACTALVVETYAIHNIYNYLTPGYFALCVLIGVACSRLLTLALSSDLKLNVRPHVRVALAAAMCSLLPAVLFARNYDRVDRSDDYTAIDFARTTLERMPPSAVILTDSWTASPLWYAQHVEGQRKDVLVSPIFSVQGEDPVTLAEKFLENGASVYVAEGLRVNAGVFQDAFSVQPILLDSISRMVTDSLPRPEYRDDFVMTGTLYKLHLEPPDVIVAEVPAGAERHVAFDDGITLVGYTGPDTALRGDVAQFSYCWRAAERINADLSAAVLFVDPSGAVQHRQGFPVWSQPRTIGQGSAPTSEWEPGLIYRESYFSLVPRTLPSGTYDVKLTVFDAASPAVSEVESSFVTIGSVRVR
jgi:hypothetical protein